MEMANERTKCDMKARFLPIKDSDYRESYIPYRSGYLHCLREWDLTDHSGSDCADIYHSYTARVMRRMKQEVHLWALTPRAIHIGSDKSAATARQRPGYIVPLSSSRPKWTDFRRNPRGGQNFERYSYT